MDKDTQKNIKETLKHSVESKPFKIVLYGIGVLIIISAIYQAGVVVGFQKATYGSNWHSNYLRNFGPVHRPRMLLGVPENIPNAHGAIGKIIKAGYPIFIVEDADKTEKIVIVKDETEIRKFKTIGTKEDLTVDAFIVVIGSPNEDGHVEAKLIRILPTPPEIIIED
jgi:hypothetical protein